MAIGPKDLLMRRRLLKYGTLATSISALSTIGLNSADAAPPPDRQPAYIPIAEKGAASGVATLDSDRKIPLAQLPNLAATIASPAEAMFQHRMHGGMEPSAFVSFTFDDGYGTAGAFFDLLTSKGVKGTLFLSSGYVDKPGPAPDWPGDSFITTAQVKKIVEQGHEIGTHGVMHESYTTYLAANGAAALHSLVTSAVGSIESQFPGVKVKTGAYPYGQSNPQVREIMGRSHEFYRGTKGKVAVRGQDPFDVLSLEIQGLSAEEVKACVDTAITNHSMCIFLVHGALTAAQLHMIGTVIDYVASNNISMGTFYEGMSRRTILRGPAGASLDASGHAYFETVRSTRLELVRGDEAGDSAWLRLNPLTNSPVFDATGGNRWEFRQRLFAGNGLQIGERTTYTDVTTTDGSTAVSSPTANFTAEDVGLPISGPGIPPNSIITARESSTSIRLSAPATASGVGAMITFGRTTAGIDVSGPAHFFSAVKISGNEVSGPSLQFETLSGAAEGTLSPMTWSREGVGGPMIWDTGTGGSVATVKAYRFSLTDHTGARRIALCAAQPSDDSLDNGEVGVYFDGETGELRFRGKTDKGVIVQRTVTTS